MSVVQSKRGETTLTVVTKARELASYTIHICSNEKTFPKRYRWCLTSKIVDAVIDINKNIITANSIYVNDLSSRLLRKSYQDIAVAETYSLLSLIDIAYCTFSIESSRVKHWTELVVNVQTLLRNWRKSDLEKTKNLN